MILWNVSSVISEGVTEETKGQRVCGIKRKFNYVRFYVNYGVSVYRITNNGKFG